MAFGGRWGSRRLGLVLALAVLVALGAWAAVSERGGRGTGLQLEPPLTEGSPPAAGARPASAGGPGGEVAGTERGGSPSGAVGSQDEASQGNASLSGAAQGAATPAGAPGATAPTSAAQSAATPAPAWQTLVKDVVRPAAGPVVTPFGWGQSVTFGDWRFHPGLDVRCPRGTPVQAAVAGQVAGVTDEAGWGLTVTLSHGYGLVSVYSGLEGVGLAPGQTVAAGAELGRVGPPGQWECGLGPHLHFELRLEDQALDPSRFLR